MKSDVSFLRDAVRRGGRILIGVAAVAAFVLGAGATHYLSVAALGLSIWWLNLAAGLVAFRGVYVLGERWRLLPDDPDEIVKMSLKSRRPRSPRP